MAHFAQIDDAGLVRRVVVVANAELIDADGNESEARGVAFLQTLYGPGVWIQTSYNGNRRKNYAGVGYKYDARLDAFIPPSPYPSWVIDEDSCSWVPPVARPDEGQWTWDEATLSWVEG